MQTCDLIKTEIISINDDLLNRIANELISFCENAIYSSLVGRGRSKKEISSSKERSQV